jgi:hypothetical protein
MSVAIAADIRNPSQRTSVLENPFWLTSGILDASTAAIDDLVVVIFSFPVAGQRIIVRQFVTEVILGFTTGTAATIGEYTLATNGVTSGGGVATLVDVDIVEATLSSAAYETAGFYFSATGDAVAKKILGVPTYHSDLFIGAATTVPAICATFGAAGTIIIGKCRYHMEISIVPGT